MNTYLLFKAIHLIAVISWMAGLLYLPRIFVYHSQTEINSKQSETFKIMERKLMLIIMNPSMIISWIFGILLIYSQGGGILFLLWVKIKIFLVVLLTFFHFYLAICLKKFEKEENKITPKFYKIINEIPTVLLISIIFIVVFKPI